MAAVFALMVVGGLVALLYGAVYSRAGAVKDADPSIAPLFKGWQVGWKVAMRAGLLSAALGLLGLFVMAAVGAFS